MKGGESRNANLSALKQTAAARKAEGEAIATKLEATAVQAAAEAQSAKL